MTSMPGTLLMFDSGAATHVGKVRLCNEDAYLARPDTGVWAVADGMGGAEAGDVASSTVIAALRSIEPPSSAADLLAACEDRVLRANGYLKDIARERGAAIIGTTVAVLLTYGSHYACVWSGDSRIYRIRDGRIAQLSHDHTAVQELVDNGMLTPGEAHNWPERHVITRAIGVQDEPELELQYGVLRPGDVFILCSDGLTTHVSDSEILDCIGTHRSQRACDDLVALTLRRGALDNVTVVVVRYRPNGSGLVLADSAPIRHGE
jgi:serine/threonine protein phosphatase PrpC